MKVAVACGGTGGHVFPGIAAAECLAARGHDVTVWLCGRGVETESAGGWRGKTETVRASGFSTGPSLSWLGGALGQVRAFLASRRRMSGGRPDVLLAMGSYASVGPALAAWSLKVPLALHEANAVPGRALSLLSRFAVVVGVAFADAAPFFRPVRVVHTGLPLKAGLDARFEAGVLREGLFTLLVMGGSQGAQRLNEVCPEAVRLAREGGLPIQVVHLAGARDGGAVAEAYRRAGVPHRVFPFLSEIGKAYNAADLAIARSGAGACLELCACGVPALFVPLPSARRDHQTANARAMARGGGADLMPQDRLSPSALAGYIRSKAADRDGLRAMGEAMRQMAVPDAAKRLAELVEAAGERGGGHG